MTVVTQGQLASVLLLHWVDDKPVKTECAKMALSTSSHPVLEPVQTIYGTADAQGRRAPTASKATALDVLKRSRVTFRRRESQVDDRRRRVALMERMIADFDRIAADLDREILIEQQRVGIHDPGHFAYPIYAKAAVVP